MAEAATAVATGRPPGFFQRLPKVELHAHLNGSISAATMKKLMVQKPNLGIRDEMVMIDKGKKRSLEECFQMFQIIHQITSRPEDILMVTKDVIQEFAADGVKYLELRSTPREEESTGMTKRTYVEAVLEGIKQCKEEELDIDVRTSHFPSEKLLQFTLTGEGRQDFDFLLSSVPDINALEMFRYLGVNLSPQGHLNQHAREFLLSVDRSKGTAAAKEVVKLAEDFLLSTDGVVVGLDLSGNPKVGHGQDFLEPLLEAKKAGLKLTLHLSEIPKQEEETRLLLSLSPDRIGHGTFLHTSEWASKDLVELVRQNGTPLELCLTSNLKAETVPSEGQHHFGFWYRLGHPVVLCTDDKGVFATELSWEYQLVAEAFRLSEEQIWALSAEAVSHIFASSHTKLKLKERWRRMRPALLGGLG